MKNKEMFLAFESVKHKFPNLNTEDIWKKVHESLQIGECNLYICNECCETFRSLVDECSFCCSNDVECLSELKKVQEKKEDTFKVIAAGIEDKTDADEIARRKKGKVVQGEDKKYSVTIQEGMGDDFFTTDVKYSYYNREEDDFIKGSVSVQWKEDIEYRSWGIKGFEITILKPLVISDGQKDITIPVENITIEWVEGYHLLPVEVEFEGDKATLTFSFVSPTYNP